MLTIVERFTQVTPSRAVPHPDQGQHCQKFHAMPVPHVLRLQVHIHVTDLHTMRKHCSPVAVSCARC